MTAKYSQHVSPKGPTPQTEPIPGQGMVANASGGFCHVLDKWGRLDRFLICGAEGSYYATERKMTIDNAKAVQECLAEDGVRVVNRIVEISEAGRAPKNDPAIFALALALSHKSPVAGNFQPLADPGLSIQASENLEMKAVIVRNAAAAAVPKVCRIGTHILSLGASLDQLRGWGRGLRRAVGNWFTQQPTSQVAYQCVKYQQRAGWSMRDLLRMTHPKAEGLTNEVLKWAVGKQPEEWTPIEDDLKIIMAFEIAKKTKDASEIVKLIRDYGLPRECIPTHFLNEVSIWEALLEKMPLTAMIRNLAKMTAVGLIAPLSRAASLVQDKLADQDYLRRSRVHPMAILVALKTYAQGHGDKGKLTWNPVPQVIDSLDHTFYASFGNVEPTGKRWLLALDVSGSMGANAIGSMGNLTCREVSAAMALVTAATEPNHMFLAYTAAAGEYKFVGQQHTPGVTPLNISPRQRLDDVVKTISDLNFGATDCALPFLYAAENNIEVDAIVSYTDNESYAGACHPSQALEQYRRKMGRPCKAVTCGMTAVSYSILPETDADCLNICGMDSAVPSLLSDFVRGF